MKTIQIRYTLIVDRTVEIRDDNKPDHYDPEDWEKQQVLDVGDEMADDVGTRNWHYQTL